MMNRGMSDAQAIKETLFEPGMDGEDDAEGLTGTIASVQKGKNPTITITVPCSPEDVGSYHIGQSVQVNIDDSEDTSLDSGFGGEG